jgi:hypothetical protein
VDGSEAAPAGQRDLYEGKEGHGNQPPGRMGSGALVQKMTRGGRENRRGNARRRAGTENARASAVNFEIGSAERWRKSGSG